MTPLQFIRDECANHQPDNSCLGAVIDPDLSIRRLRPLPRCLVAEGKRCPYFEECVAPMADMVTDPRRSAALQDAVAEYRQVTNQKAPRARPCPDCGGPLQKGRQLCPTCSIERRRDTYRKKNERRRDVLTTEVRENTPISPMISGGVLAISQNPIGDGHPHQNGQTSVVNVARRAS